MGSLTQTAAECTAAGGRCIPIMCDHADDASTQALFEHVQKAEGQLDLLVNNAFSLADIVGLAGKKFYEKPIAVWDKAHVVGLRSHYTCSWHAAKMMVEKGRGLIVNVSSAAGLGYFYDVAYGVGKAGVDRLAADMAKELRDKNVACISLWPGAVKTEYLLQQGLQIGDQKFQEEDMESPEYSGMAVCALLADPDVLAKTGKVFQSSELGVEYKFVDVDGKAKKPLVPPKAIDMGLPTLRATRKSKAPAAKL